VLGGGNGSKAGYTPSTGSRFPGRAAHFTNRGGLEAIFPYPAHSLSGCNTQRHHACLQWAMRASDCCVPGAIELGEPDALEAFFYLAWVLSANERLAEAISVYDDLLGRVQLGAATELQVRELLGQARFNKGITLAAMTRYTEAIAVFDDLVSKFSGAAELPIRRLVAETLHLKGSTFSLLNQNESAIIVYDDMLARFHPANVEPLRDLVAGTLLAKGSLLQDSHRYEDAIAAYDDLLAHFSSIAEEWVPETVAQAYLAKGDVLVKLERNAEAIAAYREAGQFDWKYWYDEWHIDVLESIGDKIDELRLKERRESDLVADKTVQDRLMPGENTGDDRGPEPPEIENLSAVSMDNAAIDLNAVADGQGVSRPQGSPHSGNLMNGEKESCKPHGVYEKTRGGWPEVRTWMGA
jgi:tetratricopeptide (TPR) repeat protein